MIATATTIQDRPFHHLYYHTDSSVTSKNEVDHGLKIEVDQESKKIQANHRF